MRALLVLLVLPLLTACGSSPASQGPRWRSASDDADLARRRQREEERDEREARERRQAREPSHSQATAERIERDGAVHPSPAAAPPARYTPPPGKAEGDRIMQSILQDAGAVAPPATAASAESDAFGMRLFRNLSPRSGPASAVAQVWLAYARMPRSQRQPQALADASKESHLIASGEAEATYFEGKLSRRAFADIVVEGSTTGGEFDDIWLPSLRWTECQTLARRMLASHDAQSAFNMWGFVEIVCLKFRESSVTGNTIVDDEKRWPVRP